MTDLFDLPFEEDDDSFEPPADASEHPGEATIGIEPAARPAGDRRLTPDQATLPAPAAAVPRPRRVFSVTELTVRVRDLLEQEFFDVWVEGELSNCRVWNTGHLYFTLKDGASQVKAVIFRSALRYLKFKPGDGLRVVARGRLSVYEPKGEYQLVCEHLEPHGLGALQLAFDQLKKRLQAEGLFDASRKRALPALPRKIGVVTSLEGAAIRDIIKVLRRRYANAHLVVCPARVQGQDAAPDLARALRQIGRVAGVDVVIVGRGGGSIEDLWAFNEEMVARAIARVPVPVISAVGHETDVTIADFVADVRAPTPSAAAEMVVAAKDQFCGRIDRLGDRLRASALARVQRLSRRVHQSDSRPAFAGFRGRIMMRGRYVSEVSHGLAAALRARTLARARYLQALERQLATFDAGRRLAALKTRLVASSGKIDNAVRRRQHRAAAQLGAVAARLDTLSPLAVLGRGYAVAWNADHTQALRDASAVTAGDTVHITLARGAIECEVITSDPTHG